MARLKSAPTTLAAPAGHLTGVPEDREYDRNRGSARERGYDAKWRRERKTFIRDHPVCLGCEAVGRAVPTKVVDHIIPHQGDRRLFDDPDNRQPCCEWHHDTVKQRLENLWRSGEIDADQLRLDSAAAIELTQTLKF